MVNRQSRFLALILAFGTVVSMSVKASDIKDDSLENNKWVVVKKVPTVAGPGNYSYWLGSWDPRSWGKTAKTEEKKDVAREEDDETDYVMLAPVTKTVSVSVDVATTSAVVAETVPVLEATVTSPEDPRRDASSVIADAVLPEENPPPQPTSHEVRENEVHDDAQTLTAALETLAITTSVKKPKKKKNITLSGFEEREPLGYVVLENGRRMPVYDELAYVIKRGKKSSRRKQATLSGRDFIERVRLNASKKWTLLAVKQGMTILYGN